MSKYIQKVERYSFLISWSVKCVTRTTKVDNSVLPEPEIFSFITRFLLENRVFLHLKHINHNNFYGKGLDGGRGYNNKNSLKILKG
jgi:hypothetical protein